MKKTIFFIFTFFLVLSNLSFSDDTQKALMTLERMGCFGKCPIYTLIIYGDGLVLYEGKEHVRVRGIHWKY